MQFYAERKTIRKIPGTVIKAVPIPKPEVIQGFGTRGQVGDICLREGYKSVLLVTDETLYGLGLHEKVLASLEKNGIKCVGTNPESDLVEIVELPTHRWYIGTQFHPEYSSTVLHPHPLFMSFIKEIAQ